MYLRGDTYGPFRPEAEGSQYHDSEYHDPEAVDRDFAGMARAGINTVRVYTVPPRWLLDLADGHGLSVLAGLPWEQHVAFLEERKRADEIVHRVRQGMQSLAGHPALLGVTVGNEIPASIVRWHGRQRIEAFLRRLYEAAKSEDPGALVTYVNFPTTEYLQLDFLDFCCFNVYLETEDKLDGYLARLQNLAGSKPLLIAEIGLDELAKRPDPSGCHSEWQIRTAFARGMAGVFVFAWTDEWHRGAHDIEDWDFGLTTRSREPKPALEAVQDAFESTPVSLAGDCPRMSVVVCSYNGSRTIADTLDHLERVAYPNFETIVVSDGSTDATAEIARRYNGVRVIETANAGLSSARNTGMRAATGEIVAYIDDDAYPDPHWLSYLAHAFLTTDHAAIGGPNLPPPGDGPIAECVAHAPGGPIQVLITDELAEHIPGCNFVVRKADLEAIGGFDPVFRAAGDDVDVCWRLQQRGRTIGFHAAALVWHHRRNSLRAYWRQQRGYGKAEALLERKWPEKYNSAGHLSWAGRLYGAGVIRIVGGRQHVYHGTWNSAPFQSLYQAAAPLWQALPQMPEWYFVNLLLGALCLAGLIWKPLFWTAPLLAFCVLVPVAQAVVSGWSSGVSTPRLKILTIALYAIQPIARLWGRLAHGLTPWRSPRGGGFAPWAFAQTSWSEKWAGAESWLDRLQAALRSRGWSVEAGGDYDSWDLQLGGLLGSARLRLAVEEHGAGKQLLRWRVWPRLHLPGAIAIGALGAFSAAAAGAHSGAAAVLGGCAILIAARAGAECARSLGSARQALRELR